jgi:hypothetical protein
MALGFDFTGAASAELQELQQLIQQQRQLLIEESGFREVGTEENLLERLGLTSVPQLKAAIAERSRAGLSEPEIARDLGLPTDDLRRINSLIQQSDQQFATVQQLNQRADRAAAGGNTQLAEQLRAQSEAVTQEIESSFQQLGQFTLAGTKLEKTEERLEQEAQLKEFQQQQRRILTLQAERQEKALRGELPLSEALQEQKKREFQQFKEGQARIGNIVVGDTLEEAAAKGTGAQSALESFRTRVAQVEGAERRGEIFAGGQLFQGALGQVPTLGPGFAGTIPQIASPFGLQSAVMASQPFFQQQQLDVQRAQIAAQMQAQQRGSSSGLWGAGIGALGTIGGAALGSMFLPGAGTMVGATAGSQFAGPGGIFALPGG